MPSVPPFVPHPGRRGRRVGMLSTYPPKLCGLATFAAALEGALVSGGDRVDIVRIDDGTPPPRRQPATAGVMRSGMSASIRHASQLLSACDVAIIQHEYGIYGGPDGDEVLEVLAALDVPSIVVLHTVPLAPTAHQQFVLEALGDVADRLVVMTDSAQRRLVAGYRVAPEKVSVIPHGAAAPDHPARDGRPPAMGTGFLTWGLLGPGKGIEHVLDALAQLQDVRPRIRYTIAGVTHPNVLAREGDRYRDSLLRQAWETGVIPSVTFDDVYRDVPALTQFVSTATAVILPYDSRDQATSGVLVDAVAAGRPVIATAFPHAVELLSGGAGIVVPHGDVQALADAMRAFACEPGLLDAMAGKARALSASLRWPAVASRYRALCEELVACAGAVAS